MHGGPPSLAPSSTTGARNGFPDHVARRLSEAPHRVAVVDGSRRVTRAQLVAEAQRLASGLLRLGVARNASIAFQLPNWYEACVVNLAAELFGFRLVPLLPMYRVAELGLILRECAVQAVFIPGQFRGVSYPDLYTGFRLPDALKHVFVVRAEDHRHASYERLVNDAHDLLDDAPGAATDVKMVLYTSGSTGKPKGVLHSHQTMEDLIHLARDFWCLSDADVALVPSPLGHIGGSMYAFDLPWIVGTTAVLMDVWNPDVAVAHIEREQVTFCAGATPFLEGLLKAAEVANTGLPSLRRFVCGGASVPPALIQRASRQFAACTVSRAYGSTEVPLVGPGIRSRADAGFGATTDGERACEVLFLDDRGDPVADGQTGEIVARAPHMFLGYLDARDNEGAFTPDGYFRMGDIGRLVEGKFIEITGRKKDLIIRMGENISPLEVEIVLAEHPAIKQVSIVGIPDARTGEAALAFVVLHDGAAFSVPEMKDFLSKRGMARQKWPEHLRVVATLPTNSIGKVLKIELRKLALR